MDRFDEHVLAWRRHKSYMLGLCAGLVEIGVIPKPQYDPVFEYALWKTFGIRTDQLAIVYGLSNERGVARR